MRKPPMNVEFFKNRRRQLSQLIPDCALVLPSWPEYYRNADNHHLYRVESNLYYMTGFEEPECCFVMRPGKNPESIMFVRQKNAERETWDGFRFGVEGTKEAFGMDATYPIEDLPKMLPGLLKGSERIYYPLFRNKEFDEIFGQAMINVHGWRPRFGLGFPPIEDAYSLVGEMRIRKSDEEIEAMRLAGSISAEAHIEMMKATKPGVTERMLHGIFIKSIMERGAYGEAYHGIVATGNNATTLHYRFNESTLQAGQLILIDCGAEYLYYSGDITRTFPVTGKFSTVQRRIYDKVLKVQKHLVSMCKPGLPHFELQQATIRMLTEVMVEEKILKGSVEDNIKSLAYQKYYPHGTSHLLGLDTHDSGILQVRGESRPLEPGWALTIEPGLYFPANDMTIDEEFRGIGIRIEDDILITEDGCENMTKGVPKEAEEMEALIGLNYR